LIATDHDGDDVYLFEYRDALDEAISRFGNRVELWLLRGNAAEKTASGRGQKGGLEGLHYYLMAEKIAPLNFAVHHYLAHTYEMMGDISAALKHAARYKALAPSAPHAHHMYAHQLRRLGRLQEAAQELQAADDLHTKLLAGHGQSDLLQDWHFVHNRVVLAQTLQLLGSNARAEALLRSLAVEQPVSEGEVDRQTNLIEFLIFQHRPSEASALAEHLLLAGLPRSRYMGHFYKGIALADQGQSDLAKQELAFAASDYAVLDPVRQDDVAFYLTILRARVLITADNEHEASRVIRDFDQDFANYTDAENWARHLLWLEYVEWSFQKKGQPIVASALDRYLRRMRH
jgi:predicted Zn-dependent protease